MSYIKNNWVDQDVERPKTYEVTNNQDNTVTLTESFGVVTEIGTPVNAVNMNHIEEGIADNDTAITTINSKIPSNASSENKMVTQEDIVPKLHALKGYLDDGELLTDSEGLADVKDYAHSTFDRSKFTIVGSPNITDDGIASGFSGSNYLSPISCNVSANQNLVIEFEYTTSDLPSSAIIPLTLFNGNTRCWFMTEASDGDLEVGFEGAGGGYIKIPFFENYKSYKFKLVTNLYDNWALYCNGSLVHQSTGVTALDRSISEIRLGSNLTSRPVNGSIDLKQFSITVDGVPVFSGNKTGIDTIKPNDFTEVGSVTFTPDGIASGFSTSNYLAYNNSITLGDDFEILTKFTTGSDVETEQHVVSSATTRRGFIIKLLAHRFRISVSGNTDDTYPWKDGGSWYGSQIIVTTNTTYYLKFGKKDGKYYIKVSTDGINWVNDFTSPTESSIIGTIPDLTIGLGRLRDNYAWLGSIDLNSFKIYVDGDLVYQPCLKIPYTESKTGSKIVDSIYRDRVNDMAEQFGYANYYTLSDTDFTLPQVELYGLIENRLDVNMATQSEKNTITGWCMPDYSNAVSYTPTSGDTVGFNGWLQMESYSQSGDSYFRAYINGLIVCRSTAGSSSGFPDSTASVIMVKSTDVLTFEATQTYSFHKIPFIGGSL